MIDPPILALPSESFVLSTALTLSYGAFLAFHHAHPRRAARAVRVRVPLDRLSWLRAFGVGLLGIALALCVGAMGTARGLPVWLGLLSITAVASLVTATLRPSWHLRSWPVVAVLALGGELLRGLA